MAAQGLRDMGDGHEMIVDAEKLRDVKRRGRRVAASSIVTALLATALFVLAR
jgi:hypothetical protein